MREYTYRPVQKERAFRQGKRGGLSGAVDVGSGGPLTPSLAAPSYGAAFFGGEEKPEASVFSLPRDAVMSADGQAVDDEDGWGVIERAVSEAGSHLVECGSNGACFFNSVVYVTTLFFSFFFGPANNLLCVYLYSV